MYASAQRLVYQSRLPSFPGDTPTIKIAPFSSSRSQSNAFSSVANAQTDLRPTIEGDVTFVARCMSMANLKPIKARRRKTHALTIVCRYYLALPSDTNTPSLQHGAWVAPMFQVNTHSATTRRLLERTQRPTFNNTPSQIVEEGGHYAPEPIAMQ